jgi:7-cyano-7-deazaguanine synthase in queuosine biosynthesis
MKFNFGSNHLRENKDIEPKALIQLSGGLDSTYCLYDWLKNNPNEYIVVHHINLINHEGRWVLELDSVYKILDWLDNNNLKNYFYLESTFDYGNLRYIIKDVEVCGFHIGAILRNPRWRSVQEVIMPIYEPEIANRQKRAAALAKMVSLRKNITLNYPIKNKTKKYVIEGMPDDLINLCWYCRKPNRNQNCGKCKTCKEVECAKTDLLNVEN